MFLEFIQSTWRATVFGLYGFQKFTKQAYLNTEKGFMRDALDVDGQGKVVLVTGANSGLGFATCKTLCERKFHVMMVCRNKERGQEAVKSIQSQVAVCSLELIILDLSRPKEIQNFVRNLPNDFSLAALVNNAGVLLNERTETPEGLETVFATNTLGVYYLTKLLLPCLPKSSRVINVSSAGMYNVPLDVDDL